MWNEAKPILPKWTNKKTAQKNEKIKINKESRWVIKIDTDGSIQTVTITTIKLW